MEERIRDLAAAAECGLNFQDLAIDWAFVLGSMAVLVAATMAIECLIIYVEKRLKQHSHYMSLLRKVYKELVILGILAAALMLVRQFSDYNHDEFMMIEFTHLWLFSVGATLVMQSILIMKLTRSVKTEWDTQLLQGTQGILQRFDENREKYPVRPKLIRYLFGKKPIREGMELFLYRDLMVKSFRLPQHFDFTKYLRRSLSVSIVHDVEIGISAWFSLVVILCVSFLSITFSQDKLDPGLARMVAFWIAVGIGWFMLITSIGINVAMERGRDILLREAGCSNLSFLDNDLRVLTQSLNAKVSKSMFQLSSSSKVAKRVIDIDVLHAQAVNRNKILKHVFPFDRPNLLKHLFDMVLLTQTFTIGLVLIGALAGFGENRQTGFTMPRWSALLIGLLPHLIMVTFFFPHIIRTMTVLNAMCKVDRKKLEIVQQVLILQEATQGISVRFSRFLCDTITNLTVDYYKNGMSFPQETQRSRSRTSSWVALARPLRSNSNVSNETAEIVKYIMLIPKYRNRIIEAMSESQGEDQSENNDITEIERELAESVEVCIRHLFKVLDSTGTQTVTASSLVKTITEHPYNFRINEKQTMYLLRSLGFHHGFNITQFVSIVDGAFLGQIRAREQKLSSLELCFGHIQEIRCNICDKPVDLKHLPKHAAKCAPQDLETEELEDDEPDVAKLPSRRHSMTIKKSASSKTLSQTRPVSDRSKIVPMKLERPRSTPPSASRNPECGLSSNPEANDDTSGTEVTSRDTNSSVLAGDIGVSSSSEAPGGILAGDIQLSIRQSQDDVSLDVNSGSTGLNPDSPPETETQQDELKDDDNSKE